MTLVAVLGFAVAQVSLAAHQFTHDGATAEICATCVQLDQFESAVIPAGLPSLAYPTDRVANVEGARTAVAELLLSYSIRAPPTI